MDLCAIMEAELRFSQQVLAIPEIKKEKMKRNKKKVAFLLAITSKDASFMYIIYYILYTIYYIHIICIYMYISICIYIHMYIYHTLSMLRPHTLGA